MFCLNPPLIPPLKVGSELCSNDSGLKGDELIGWYKLQGCFTAILEFFASASLQV
jgi:hypothetical protein